MEKEKTKFELLDLPLLPQISDKEVYKGREQKERKKFKTSGNTLLGTINVDVDKVIVEKIKDYAYWERLNMRKAMSKILSEFLSNKNLESRPKNVGNSSIQVSKEYIL